METTTTLKNFQYNSSDRVVLLVEYCGKNYYGSQRQKEYPTVQAAIENALRQMNLKTSAVTFSSRTDSGVHAQGQVAHFDLFADVLPDKTGFLQSLNAILPRDIVIHDAHFSVPSIFHSRRSASGKWYRYTLLNSPCRQVLLPPNVVHYPKRFFDAEKMNQAAALLIGLHNFKSFKSADTHVIDDVCNVLYAKVTQIEDFIHFDIVANRFLYKMVRSLMGQLLLIGREDSLLQPESLLEVMRQQDRKVAAAPARPEGLTLKAVLYPSPFNYFALNSQVQHITHLLNSKEMELPQNEDLFRKAS